jgi:predicted DNA-binding antitoxin AbrB/MazE fold protein
MNSSVDAIYEDGVFKPEQPVSLKEKTRVHLVIEDASPASNEIDPTGWETAESFVGFIKDAPAGEPIAREHDKHLYK